MLGDQVGLAIYLHLHQLRADSTGVTGAAIRASFLRLALGYFASLEVDTSETLKSPLVFVGAQSAFKEYGDDERSTDLVTVASAGVGLTLASSTLFMTVEELLARLSHFELLRSSRDLLDLASTRAKLGQTCNDLKNSTQTLATEANELKAGTSSDQSCSRVSSIDQELLTSQRRALNESRVELERARATVMALEADIELALVTGKSSGLLHAFLHILMRSPLYSVHRIDRTHLGCSPSLHRTTKYRLRHLATLFDGPAAPKRAFEKASRAQ